MDADLVTPRWWASQLAVANELRQQAQPSESALDSYTGQWQSDKRSGIGVVRCANGDVYIGEWAAGVRSGAGACAFGSGDLYEGTWKEDRMHGTGALMQSTGQLFVGSFAAGAPHGPGRCHYTDGSVYEGEFSEGVRDGAGRLKLPSGAVYVGRWRRDMRDGHGTMTGVDGTVYSGMWLGDQRHGQGRLVVGGVQVFEGAWFDNERCGYGVGPAPDPALSLDDAHLHASRHHLLGAAQSEGEALQYEGEWRGGRPNGHGRLVRAPGGASQEPAYVGQWVEGERRGHGVGLLASADVYEGGWEHGEPHGFGVAHVELVQREGMWQHGLLSGPGLVRREAVASAERGEAYVGYLLEGAPRGVGTLHTREGDVLLSRWHRADHGGHNERTLCVCKYGGGGGSYVGQWRDGRRDGVGVETWGEGARFAGAWQLGVRQGFGELTTPDGSRLVGEWSEDKPSGVALSETGAAGAEGGGGGATPHVRHLGEWLRGQAHGFGLREADGLLEHVGWWRHGRPIGETLATDLQPAPAKAADVSVGGSPAKSRLLPEKNAALAAALDIPAAEGGGGGGGGGAAAADADDEEGPPVAPGATRADEAAAALAHVEAVLAAVAAPAGDRRVEPSKLLPQDGKLLATMAARLARTPALPPEPPPVVTKFDYAKWGPVLAARGKFVGTWVVRPGEGEGAMLSPEGDVLSGEWKNGLLEGEGRRVYAEGDAYDGQFVGSRRHGRGTHRSLNGDEYSGEWQRDLRHGKGSFRMSNGDVLEGLWVKDLAKGAGRLREADGTVYEGQFSLSRPHGEGTLWRANGDVVRGHFSCGEPSGRCVIEYESGARYEGPVWCGRPHGVGVLIAEGISYEGSFVLGEKWGEGIERFDQGSSLKCVWARNLPNAAGTLITKDGGRVQGRWVDGAPEGAVRLTLPNGNVVEQENAAHCIGEGQIQTPEGNVYQGSLLGGLPHGSGVWVMHDDTTFKATFSGGLAHGEGELLGVKGDSYVGEWRRGARHGHGTQRWAEEKGDFGEVRGNKVYQGQWAYDEPHGRGVMRDAARGVATDGEWVHGCPEGEVEVRTWGEAAAKAAAAGAATPRGATLYRGQMVGGVMEGFGRWSPARGLLEGCAYVGEMKRDLPEGEGTCTLADGGASAG